MGGFGAPAASTAAPAFGGFGAPAATSAPAFGGFGAPAATSAPAFGGFGAPAASTASTGFGFGAPAATSTPAFGGFGATTATTSAAPAFGGFGSAAGTKPAAFGGFGTAGTTGFGTGATTGFGAGATTGFGTGATGFGGAATGFGAPAAAGTGFGAPAVGAQNNPANPVDSLYTAVLHCSLYNDERDSIIARWNMLQASWGKGKAYFSNTAPPVDLTPENPFCRFKAIGYSAMPKHDNKEGLVCLLFKKKTEEVEANKASIISGVSQMMGNKPNLKVEVLSVKNLGGNSGTTELVLTVTEQQQGGATRKVPASDLQAFLSGQAAQLKTAGVEMVVPKLSFTKADIATYLDTPPAGIDARLWKQAQKDNPDPSNLLPVPMVGFKALQERTAAQEKQAKAHGGRLDTISTDLAELQKKAADTLAALTEAKRRQLELSHRVLRVLVRQESTRKVGFTITQQEEVIRGQLENLQAELATPTQFKGRLNELLSQVRLQSQTAVLSGGEKYSVDQFALTDIRNVLKDQQEGIQALVACVREDLADLATMAEGLQEGSSKGEGA